MKYKDAPSILQSGGACYFCNSCMNITHHHVFEGTANRRQSAKYGLWICVCPYCHAYIHREPKRNLWLKKHAQEAAQAFYGWSVDDFRERFGKSYL